MAETIADKGEGNTGAGSPRPGCGRAEVPTSRRPGSGRTAGRGALPGKSRLVPPRGPEAKRRFTSGGKNQNFSLGQKKELQIYSSPLLFFFKLQQQTEMKTVFFCFFFPQRGDAHWQKTPLAPLLKSVGKVSKKLQRRTEVARHHGGRTADVLPAASAHAWSPATPGWSGSHVLLKLDFLFFLIQSWVSQIDAAAFHYLQPRRPDASNNMPCHSRHCPTLHRSFLSRGSTTLSRSRTRHRQDRLTCCDVLRTKSAFARTDARRGGPKQIKLIIYVIKKRGDDFFLIDN